MTAEEQLLAEMTAHHAQVAHPGVPCREDRRGVCMAGRPDDGREVWLTVYPSGGLAGVSLDRSSASRHAAAVGGVLVAVPIVEDYRGGAT